MELVSVAINVLGPARRVCDVCPSGMECSGILLEDDSGDETFICITCLQQMVEDVASLTAA